LVVADFGGCWFGKTAERKPMNAHGAQGETSAVRTIPPVKMVRINLRYQTEKFIDVDFNNLNFANRETV
jgi:hypothetical protein